MAKTKKQKTNIIKDLTDDLEKQKSVVLVDFAGVPSKDLFQLRDGLKKEGCQFKVVKKTLLEKALEGLKATELLEKVKAIKGQVALAFGFGDEVAPARLCFEFGKNNENFSILGAILGKDYLEKEKALEFAQLPSRQELLGRFAGVLRAVPQNFVYVLQGNIKGLIICLDKISKR